MEEIQFDNLVFRLTIINNNDYEVNEGQETLFDPWKTSIDPSWDLLYA